MYFWKVDRLVEDFKNDRVTQLEEFKYMLLFTFLVALLPLAYIECSFNQYDIISTLCNVVVSVFGLYYCYRANKNGDNKNFIARMMCLGLPVTIRLVVFSIPIFLVGSFFSGDFFIEAETYETTLFSAGAGVLFCVVYYWYLGQKIRAVSLK